MTRRLEEIPYSLTDAQKAAEVAEREAMTRRLEDSQYCLITVSGKTGVAEPCGDDVLTGS